MGPLDIMQQFSMSPFGGFFSPSCFHDRSFAIGCSWMLARMQPGWNEKKPATTPALMFFEVDQKLRSSQEVKIGDTVDGSEILIRQPPGM